MCLEYLVSVSQFVGVVHSPLECWLSSASLHQSLKALEGVPLLRKALLPPQSSHFWSTLFAHHHISQLQLNNNYLLYECFIDTVLLGKKYWRIKFVIFIHRKYCVWVTKPLLQFTHVINMHQSEWMCSVTSSTTVLHSLELCKYSQHHLYLHETPHDRFTRICMHWKSTLRKLWRETRNVSAHWREK